MMKLRIIAVLGTMAFAPALMPALASESAHPAIGDISVFATVPTPGHPFGVAVDKNRVYISTSAGDFFASPFTGGHLNSDGERVFAYDMKGNLVKTTPRQDDQHRDDAEIRHGAVRPGSRRQSDAKPQPVCRRHERADPAPRA